MTAPNTITGQESVNSQNQPLQALVQFYKALNDANLELMTKNWSQSSEIVMNNPLGGVRRGWDEVRELYQRVFNGSAKVYVEFYDYSLQETPHLFYVVGRERGYFRNEQRTIELSIRTSRIFKNIQGQWKQVHHHGSIENPNLLQSYQQAVM